MMRRDGDWMMPVDERVLEYLRENDQESANQLSKEVPNSSSPGMMAARLRALAQAEYVEPLGPIPYNYCITNHGIGYLEGRYRADALYPAPSPERPGFVLG